MSKELFKVVIPFTVNHRGKVIDLTEQFKEYFKSKHAQELNNSGNMVIEDEIYFKYDKLPLEECAKIDPRHVLAYGHFGDIKENGIEYICTGFVSNDISISLYSIRFASPIVTKDKKKILMTHIIAKKVFLKEKDKEKDDTK